MAKQAETETETKSARPEFLFVLNSAKGPRTLMWHARKLERGQVASATKKTLGPGMNFVEADGCLRAGIDEVGAFEGTLRVVNPLELRDHDAEAIVEKTASRQAAIEWQRIDSRPKVVEALRKRLAKRGPRGEDA
jgi:hypothetical protein